MPRDERGVTAALSRAASASQRAALVVERNVRYARGGDRRSWKFAHESWVEGQEYLDKARALQDKIAANGGDQTKAQLLRLEKTHAELAAEARVSERTIDDAAKAHDAGSPDLLDAVRTPIGHNGTQTGAKREHRQP